MNAATPHPLLPPADGTLGYVRIGDVLLDSGVLLPQVAIALQCWGTLNADASNIILIEHALTGDSHVVGPQDALHPTAGWWPGMVGPDCPIDTNRWFVICTNTLGGCRGTTGPPHSTRTGIIGVPASPPFPFATWCVRRHNWRIFLGFVVSPPSLVAPWVVPAPWNG